MPARRPSARLSPLGLVVHTGRWYLAAFDHGRDDLRTFRADRIRRPVLDDEPAVPPPAGFDAVAYVSTSLARTPWRWEVEVLLDLPFDEAARRVPATLAELVEADGGTLAPGFAWARSTGPRASSPVSAAASRSVGPEELRTSIRALADRLAESAWRA